MVSPGGLTREQQENIARKKQIAMERRERLMAEKVSLNPQPHTLNPKS